MEKKYRIFGQIFGTGIFLDRILGDFWESLGVIFWDFWRRFRLFLIQFWRFFGRIFEYFPGTFLDGIFLDRIIFHTM